MQAPVAAANREPRRLTSYAEAAAKGAALDDGQDKFPIERNDESENIESGESACAKLIKILDSYNIDPATASSVLAAIVAGTGAGFYLFDQHKHGKLTWPLAIVTGVGVGAVGVIDYFSFKNFSKKPEAK
jgi:hypothetical protein